MAQATRFFTAILGLSTEPLLWTPPPGKRAVITCLAIVGSGRVTMHLIPSASGGTGVGSQTIYALASSAIVAQLLPVEAGEYLSMWCSTGDTANIVAHGYLEDSRAKGIRVVGRAVLGAVADPLVTFTKPTIITQIAAINTSAGALTPTLYDVPFGHSFTNAHRIYSASVPPSSSLLIDVRLAMATGDSIWGVTTTGAVIPVWIVGFEP